MTRALAHIARMSPYALAELNVPNGKPLLSLSQNESLRAPSPRAIEAAAGALSAAAHYPDPDWRALRQALSRHHDIAADCILCGSGSLDLIGCIARVFSGPRRSVLAPEHAYPFFRTAAQMANARFDTAKEVNATISVDALLGAMRPDTRLVFVANPGNPTGTRIPKAELLRLRAGLRKDILLVIDEAYGEFTDHPAERCFDMTEAGNTVVLRTFSKAYGMAGFRVGWGLFPPDIAREIRKVMNPNNIPAASQAAATAALADQDYMRETCALTTTLRDETTLRLRRAGFEVHPSSTNFVLIDMGSTEAARSADAALRAQGVFLRAQAAAGLPRALRMTMASEGAMAAALSHLEAWKKEHAT